MGILDDAIREHLELKRAHGADESEVRRKEAEAFGQAQQEAAESALAGSEEHTQLLTPETHVAEPAALDVDALQPAPEDPYAVHPGDEPVPDPSAAPVAHADHVDTEPAGHFDTETAAEAGAGMLEPHEVEPGPPTPPEPARHQTDEHPALVDHDRIHREEHPPEPVFRQPAEAPVSPPAREEPPAPAYEEPSSAAYETPTAPPDAPLEPSPVDDPPVGDPPVVRPDVDEPPPRQSPASAEDHEVGAIEGPAEDVLEDTPEFLQDAPEHDRLWFEQKPPRDFDFGE